METFASALQVVIALGIVNVWLIRPGRAARFRPADADSMAEEFRRYGFSDRTRVLVGATKLGLAAALLFGIAFEPVAGAAAAGMSVLMAGAILAHVRVGDPLVKSTPAFAMLVMSATVVLIRVGG